ncbi:hypothetical protein GCM10022408_33950 [Hymenobacter fastidiosus]|uniref:Uncharacterized protein n=1 Tax=Hymenobacter fastidiosus TaxID=486264 RepID=A0ABP7SWQ7_9BACT
MLPAVRQQCQLLETRLSPAGKTQLATYRAQLRDVRQRGQAFRRSLPSAGQPAGTRPPLAEAQRQQMQQLRPESRGIMLSAARMAQKYEVRITSRAQALQPRKEQWTADIQAIIARNTTPEQRSRLARRHQGGLGRFSRPTRFLLPEPQVPGPAPLASGSPVYPNPAVTTNQLRYEVS